MNADVNAQGFVAAFKARHPTLAATSRIELLSLPDGEAGMDVLLNSATRTPPAVIIAMSGFHGQLTRRAAPDVPLVFSSMANPLRMGLASAMLRRAEPSTGLWIDDKLDSKRVELLLDAYPSLRSIAVLGDQAWLSTLGDARDEMRQLAASRGVALHLEIAQTAEEALSRIDAPDLKGVQAWCLPRTALTLDRRLARHIAASGKPVMAGHTAEVYDAAHLSYAQDKSFVPPALADLAARVLQGEFAGSIPIQTPHRLTLAVRLTQDSRLPEMNSLVIRRADLVVRSP